MKTKGPSLTVQASCSDCEWERSESYRCQSDSGHAVYCDHPSRPEGKGRIGDTTWSTPKWCPLLRRAMTELLDKLKVEAIDERQ